MKKTAAKKKPMYGKGTAKTKTKPAAKQGAIAKQREANKLVGRGIPERVVKQMLGTMGRGGMTAGAVMKKYGYGGMTGTKMSNLKKKK